VCGSLHWFWRELSRLYSQVIVDVCSNLFGRPIKERGRKIFEGIITQIS
jgi:hypothetical protein